MVLGFRIGPLDASVIIAFTYCLILFMMIFLVRSHVTKNYDFSRSKWGYYFLYHLVISIISVIIILQIEFYFTTGLLKFVLQKGIVLYFIIDIFFSLEEIKMLRAKPLSDQFKPVLTLIFLVGECCDLALEFIALYFFVRGHSNESVRLFLKTFLWIHVVYTTSRAFHEFAFMFYKTTEAMNVKKYQEISEGSSQTFSLYIAFISSVCQVHATLISRIDLSALSEDALLSYSLYLVVILPLVIGLKFTILHTNAYRYYLDRSDFKSKVDDDEDWINSKRA